MIKCMMPACSEGMQDGEEACRILGIGEYNGHYRHVIMIEIFLDIVLWTVHT